MTHLTPVMEMDCFCCFSSHFDRQVHPLRHLLGHLQALNILRLERPKPQGRCLGEWLLLPEIKPPPHCFFYCTFYLSFIPVLFTSPSSVCALFQSMHQSLPPLSLPLSCICIFTRVHITGVRGRVRSSREGKPLGE